MVDYNHIIVLIVVVLVMLVFFNGGNAGVTSEEGFTGVKYLGCYEDDKERHLKGKRFEFVNNNPDLCSSFCREHGYRYAGLQHGTHCFCDNKPKRGFGRKVFDSKCNHLCPSNKSKGCGGVYKNSIYDTGLLGEFGDRSKSEDELGDYVSTDYIDYGVPNPVRSCNCNQPEYIQNTQGDDPVNQYVGCFRETPESNLKFKVFPKGDPKLTPKRCQYLCRNHGYKYAGMQFGNECWCGNGEKGLGEQRPEWECNNPCAGDQRQKCGGILRQNIYQVKGGGIASPP